MRFRYLFAFGQAIAIQAQPKRRSQKPKAKPAPKPKRGKGGQAHHCELICLNLTNFLFTEPHIFRFATERGGRASTRASTSGNVASCSQCVGGSLPELVWLLLPTCDQFNEHPIAIMPRYLGHLVAWPVWRRTSDPNQPGATSWNSGLALIRSIQTCRPKT